MTEIVEKAIRAVQESRHAFCKFISANDAGTTGAHQSGFYIPKNCWPLMFDNHGVRGKNKDHFIKIKWQEDFYTDSRFIYYGVGTRDEYRLTRFGRHFPFLNDDNVGDLIILCRMDEDDYKGYVLSTDDDIEDFFSAFNISSEQTNQLIEKELVYHPEEKLQILFDEFVDSLDGFPATTEMSRHARESYIQAWGVTENLIRKEPDKQLLEWAKAEYELFKAFEIRQYSEKIKTPFSSVDELITFSNTVLNRRKSRAGKSLEHHLAHIFRSADLRFEMQVITEENKKPDFIFPGSAEYHNFQFPANELVCLGAKTTCKDRWRQILNEADRVPVKHLFTLQQGISKNQLSEMYTNNVCLVVPAPYRNSFSEEYRDRIMTLGQFNSYVKEMQN